MVAVGAGAADAVACAADADAGAGDGGASCALLGIGRNRPPRMTRTIRGKRTDQFIGTLSKRSRDNYQQPVPKDNPPPQNPRPFVRVTSRRISGRRSSPIERPCESHSDLAELRVAPVRSAGSPVAGLDWRQKIKHRCSETKTFYVSSRSRRCLLGQRGAWRPCRTFNPFEVTVSHSLWETV